MRHAVLVLRHVLKKPTSVQRRSCMAHSPQSGASLRQDYTHVFSVDAAVQTAGLAPALATLPFSHSGIAALRRAHAAPLLSQVRATLLELGVSGPASSVTLSVPYYEGRPSRHDILVSADSAERLNTCLAELRKRFAAEIASRRYLLVDSTT